MNDYLPAPSQDVRLIAVVAIMLLVGILAIFAGVLVAHQTVFLFQ